MNLNVVFEIAELALSVVKSHATGKVQEGTALADTLLELIHKTIHAYKEHTGAMPDPALIGVT
jgi:hypothetical protein